MWAYIIGAATIFGAIVTIGVFFNGRLTRREIIKVLVKEARLNRELLKQNNQLLKDTRRYLEN